MAGATAVAERPDETAEALDAELDLDAPVDESDVGSRERVLARPERDVPVDEYEEYDEYEDFDDDEVPEPRAYRPGRGGFDPDAAAAAALARHTFRQRVALGLIVVAVLSALAALVVTATLWWLFAATTLVLVGYLVFLRRQTRIEEEVRARRAARLSGERRAIEARRARQAEHEARMAALDEWAGEADADDEDEVWEDEAWEDDEADELEEPAPLARWAAPRTPAPAVPADLELVEDSDDDPAFHDLDGERIPSYRRAAAGA